MKIIAIDEETKNLVNVNTINPELKRKTYLCPVHLRLNKNAEMHKVDRKGTLFFRYQGEVDKVVSDEIKSKAKGGESKLHLKTKEEIARLWLNDGRKNVEMEKIFYNDGKLLRIADVYGETKEGSKQVTEIQISNILLDDLIRRTKDYEEKFGIDDVIWLLDKKISNVNTLINYLFNNGYKYGIIEVVTEKKLLGVIEFQLNYIAESPNQKSLFL